MKRNFMIKLTSVLFPLIVSIPIISWSQINVATTAVSTHSSGGNTLYGYGPELYNDGVIPTHLSSNINEWGWINAGGWIEYNWTSPQTFDSITFHNGGGTVTRHFSTLVVEYWNGSSFVNVGTVTGSTNSTTGFKPVNPITTNRLRFNNITGGASSPAFREIQCWQPIPKDYGITSIIEPIGVFCPGQHTVKAIITNFSNATATNIPVQWSVNGVMQTPYTFTGTLQANNNPSGGYSDTINLGNANMALGQNVIKVWTNEPNDVQRNNDTNTVNLSPTVFTIDAVTDTLCPGGHTNINILPNFGYNASMIQWQESTNGTTYTNITTSPTFSYNTGSLNNIKYYRAFIQSGSGCSSNDVAVHVINANIHVDLGNDTSLCNPNTLLLDAGNAGATYLWQDNSTNQTLVANAPGRYFVTVTNMAGCSASDTINFEWNAPPEGNFYANNWGGVNLATYTISATMQNVDRYYWDLGDGSPQISTNPLNHTYATSGAYTIKLHLFNECGDEVIITKKVDAFVGIDDIQLNNALLVYPNPANAIIHVESKNQEKIEQYILIDVLGRKVLDEKVNSNKLNIDIANLVPGVYLLTVYTPSGSYIQKVTKQ